MSMPNLKPCPDNIDALNKQLDIIKKDALVNVFPYGSVSIDEKDQELADIDGLHKKVKAISDDGRGVNNIDILINAMKLAKKYDLVIASHAEDNNYGLAPEGEFIAVRREIEYAKEIGCKYHFCHMSTRQSFEAIRKAMIEYDKKCEIPETIKTFNKNKMTKSFEEYVRDNGDEDKLDATTGNVYQSKYFLKKHLDYLNSLKQEKPLEKDI